MRSASTLSGTPVVRTTRDRITRPFARDASRGRTSWVIRLRISRGTPGSMITSPGSPASQMPGAVPHRLGRTAAPRGTSAWHRFRSAIVRPRRAQRSVSSRQISSRNSSGAAKSSATATLVRSSFVGPNPPVVMTRRVRPSACATASRTASGASGTEVRRVIRKPAPESAWPRKAELESTMKPRSSSLPMVTSSRSMRRKEERPSSGPTRGPGRTARDTGTGR